MPTDRTASTLVPAERLTAALEGRSTDRVPVMPKIWFTLAARILDIRVPDLIGDPELAMRSVVDAARAVHSDGARLFLWPRRQTRWQEGTLLEVDAAGRPRGEIDQQGGLATRLARAEDFHIEDPHDIAFHTCWSSETPLVSSRTHAAHLAVPDKRFYEQSGHGAIVRRIREDAGDRIGLAGDCDSATLAFCVSLRGMHQALIDLIDDPPLVHALMEKGEAFAIERGKFFLDQGVHILRLNDSVANMSVISPAQWRTFVKPHMRQVCQELHACHPRARIYCHICGNVRPIVEDLLEVGIDCIAPLDPLGGSSVADLRRAVGKDVVLMGGVDTLAFVRDTPQQVLQQAVRCLDANGDGPFVLGSGCALPADSRVDNIAVLAEAAKQRNSRR